MFLRFSGWGSVHIVYALLGLRVSKINLSHFADFIVYLRSKVTVCAEPGINISLAKLWHIKGEKANKKPT